MSKLSDIYNFLRVTPALSTSGQPSEEGLAALAADGCEVIVNLALHDDPRYSLADEAGTVEALGMAYVHIPVPFDAPAEGDLLSFFAAMDIHGRKKIHLHCAANMRVTAFLGLYGVIRQGKPLGDAFSPMDEIWKPSKVWAAFIDAMLAKYARVKAG